MEGLAQVGDEDFRCCKEVFEAMASFPLEIPDKETCADLGPQWWSERKYSDDDGNGDAGTTSSRNGKLGNSTHIAARCSSEGRHAWDSLGNTKPGLKLGCSTLEGQVETDKIYILNYFTYTFRTITFSHPGGIRFDCNRKATGTEEERNKKARTCHWMTYILLPVRIHTLKRFHWNAHIRAICNLFSYFSKHDLLKVETEVPTSTMSKPGKSAIAWTWSPQQMPHQHASTSAARQHTGAAPELLTLLMWQPRKQNGHAVLGQGAMNALTFGSGDWPREKQEAQRDGLTCWR